MVTYFPNIISRKAIYCYFITLAIVSVVFMDQVLPFVWMLFGSAEVVLFFYFSNRLTKQWRGLPPIVFVKRLFWTSLVIRLVYMVFVYFFYDFMTGQPFMFHSADEQLYFETSKIWCEQGLDAFRNTMQWIVFSDSGEIYYASFLCLLFGPFVLPVRIGHCLLGSLTCVLIYRIAKRHFNESTARMAAVLCMLMPNLIYYCGIQLKEVEMVFVTTLMVDSVDALLSERKFDWKNLVAGVLAAFAMFSFRTALGVVGLLSVMVALLLNQGKLVAKWQRIGLAALIVVVISATTIGNRMLGEMSELWEEGGRSQNINMEWRSQREGGNSLAKYASEVVFAPAIFTIPFASMVYTEGQENQQMIHGGNFVKNIMSGFVVFALVVLLFSGDWRKHTLPLALLLGYLVVVAFSSFAHSERFHQPAIPFELMFAAYGISILKQKHVQWIDYWMAFVMAANVAWAWFKLAGRGLA